MRVEFQLSDSFRTLYTPPPALYTHPFPAQQDSLNRPYDTFYSTGIKYNSNTDIKLFQME